MIDGDRTEKEWLLEVIRRQQLLMAILFGEAVERGADAKTLLERSEEIFFNSSEESKQ